MYNGIGLTTVRGSGTNGHVRRNASGLRAHRFRARCLYRGPPHLVASLARWMRWEVTRRPSPTAFIRRRARGGDDDDDDDATTTTMMTTTTTTMMMMITMMR